MQLPSLDILRAQLSEPGATLTPAMRRALAADPRKGAQALLSVIDGRLAREKLERARQSRMLAHEREIWDTGVLHIAGVDEVGVGPLAGPVYSAAVILPHDFELPGLNDSKQILTAERRQELAREVHLRAVAVSIGVAEVEEIDRINIRQATFLAMRRAVEGLTIKPEHLLIDAHRIPGVSLPQRPLVKGDTLSSSIAAASVVAKVARDALMAELDREHPGYGFAEHAGYATPEHLAVLRERAPCAIHRRSFAPVRASFERFGELRASGTC